MTNSYLKTTTTMRRAASGTLLACGPTLARNAHIFGNDGLFISVHVHAVPTQQTTSGVSSGNPRVQLHLEYDIQCHPGRPSN